jgi:hypothetical protein
MFLGSVKSMANIQPKTDEIAVFNNEYAPSGWAGFKASVNQGWDWATSYVDTYRVNTANYEARQEGVKPFASEEEMMKSEYYRPGVAWNDGMTETGLQYISERYDNAREQEYLVQQTEEHGLPFISKFGNFMGGMVGSIPDPGNIATMFLPPVGVAGAVGRAAGATAARTISGTLARAGTSRLNLLKASARPSVWGSAAAGNLASASFTANNLNPYGENIGMADIITMTAVGTVLGTGFHAVGNQFMRGRSQNLVRQRLDEVAHDMPSNHQAELAEMRTRMEKGDLEVYRDFGATYSDAFEDAFFHQSVNDAVRAKLTGSDRAWLALHMQDVMDKVAKGEPVDGALTQNPHVRAVFDKVETLGREYVAQVADNPLTVNAIAEARDVLNAVNAALKENSTLMPRDVPELQATRSRLNQLTRELDTLTSLKQEALLGQASLNRIQQRIDEFRAHVGRNGSTPEDVARLVQLRELSTVLKNKVAEIKAKIGTEMETILPKRTRPDDPTVNRPHPTRPNNPDIELDIAPRSPMQEMIDRGMDVTTGTHVLERQMREAGLFDAETLAKLDETSRIGDELNAMDRALMSEKEGSNFASCILESVISR